MFFLQANKNTLFLRKREPITSGSVHANRVRFEFSDEWDGLIKTAVFRAEEQSYEVILPHENECFIPWEALEKPSKELYVGVYGVNGEELILPTIWASLGEILEGASPGETAQKPTPGVYEQVTVELANKADNMGYTREGELGLFAGEKLLSSVAIQGGGEESIAYNWMSPQMTSDTTPAPYVASASSFYDGNSSDKIILSPWKAFDNNVIQDDCWHIGMTEYGSAKKNAWIQFDFGNIITTGGIELTPRYGYANQAPTEFTVFASTDGENWITIADFTATWNSEAPKSFDYPNKIKTKYIRLTNFQESGQELSIGNIRFYNQTNANLLAEVYSTDEIRVGTWIDGKPIYRKVVQGKTQLSSGWKSVSTIPHLDTVIKIEGVIHSVSSTIVGIFNPNCAAGIISKNQVAVYHNVPNEYGDCPCTIIVNYTKSINR